MKVFRFWYIPVLVVYLILILLTDEAPSYTSYLIKTIFTVLSLATTGLLMYQLNCLPVQHKHAMNWMLRIFLLAQVLFTVRVAVVHIGGILLKNYLPVWDDQHWILHYVLTARGVGLIYTFSFILFSLTKAVFLINPGLVINLKLKFVLPTVAVVMLAMIASDILAFSLVCRYSSQVYEVDKRFQVAAGYILEKEDLENPVNTMSMPLCTPVSYLGIPLILLEIIKTATVLYKFFNKNKQKYMNERKRKQVAELMVQLYQNRENDKINQVKNNFQRSNSLTVSTYSEPIPNQDLNPKKLRKLSLQLTIRNISQEKEIPESTTVPTMIIALITMKDYIIRSNFIFVFVVTVIAVSKWTSDGSAVGVAFKTEMIGAFYVPIFLFLTQAKIINNVMRLFPINP